MNATIEKTTVATVEQHGITVLPEFAVPTAELAIAIVNRWLHRDVGMLVHVSRASFNPITYCWRLPIELAYPRIGMLGVIGDIHLTANGQFVGAPEAKELQRRATELAEAYGFTEEDLEKPTIAALPESAVPTADRAISLVNGWLLREVGTAVHVSQAIFRAATDCWHLPVLLAYPDTGPVGVIGDVFLHAATGRFIGSPEADELERRAIAMAEAHGLVETDEEE